jgi:hypothetical protein
LKAIAARVLGIPAMVFLATLPAACSVAQGRIGIDAPPEDQFSVQNSVGDYLDHRCGSLDCHGQPGRNLRIWGCFGMRLDPKDISSCTIGSGTAQPRITTPDEYHATYRSLVGLEPAVMSEVMQSNAANPELLTFVRKARGLESHKGGRLITPGDDQDTCIVSWLQGNTDMMACGKAAFLYPMFLAPMGPDASTSP